MSIPAIQVKVVECRNCNCKVFFRKKVYRSCYIGKVALDGFYRELAETASIERCPFCGYCNQTIGKVLFEDEEFLLNVDLISLFEEITETKIKSSKEKTTEKIISELVSSEEYNKQLHSALFPEKANYFLCASMIEERLGNFSSAGLNALKAA